MRYFLLLPILLLTSCASLFNSPTCETTIISDTMRTIVVNRDTIALVGNGNRYAQWSQNIVVRRSNLPLEISIITGDKTDTAALKPIWSPAYYCNFYALFGFIIDGRTSKKWQYPRTVYITDRWIRKHKPASIHVGFHNVYAGKNVFNLRISLPWMNGFNFSGDGNERKSKLGFMGLSLGLDYFYNDRSFVNLSGTGIADIIVPFPASIHFTGMTDHMSSVYGSLTNNHLLNNGKYSIGYGISYGRDIWNTLNHGGWEEGTDEATINQENIYRRSNSLGFATSLYYYTKRSFYMGFIYRPMLLQFTDETEFKYQHTISFDLGWRIKL